MKINIRIYVTLIWCFFLLTTACCKFQNNRKKSSFTEGRFALISASANNEFFFNSEKISSSDLEQKITEFCESKKLKDRNIYLEGDALTKYGAIVSILSAIRENNINRVHLVISKDKERNSYKTIEAEICPKLPPRENFYSYPTEWFFITVKSDSAMNQRIELNKHPMSVVELNEFLENVYKHRLDKSLCVGATTDQTYGDFLELVKDFEELGVKPIILRLEYLDEDIPSHHGT